MGQSRKKWKKRSGGTADSQHKATIFIDRNSGGRNSKEIILGAGINVLLHDEHLKNNTTDDHVWIKEIANLGWIMVSCDFKIANTPLSLHAIQNSTAKIFLLSGLNGATPQGKADCIIKYYNTMLEISASRKAPFLARIDLDGKVHFVDVEGKLDKMHKGRRI